MEMSQFPLLNRLVRKYLYIYTTSVTSQRIFSAAGYVNLILRSFLKPSKIDQLTILARNLD